MGLVWWVGVGSRGWYEVHCRWFSGGVKLGDNRELGDPGDTPSLGNREELGVYYDCSRGRGLGSELAVELHFDCGGCV